MSIISFSGFFSRVEYEGACQNDNWQSKAEKAAEVLRAPSHWFAAELWYREEHVIDRAENGEIVDMPQTENREKVILKVLRIVSGIFLGIPGQILALPLMALAYTNEEIRLKRRMTVQKLTDDEVNRLKELINARIVTVDDEQREPITCSLLCSICYMMCCLLCRK